MATSAHIQKYRKNEEGHTEFFIKVFYKGKQWAIRKRFSEFVQLDDFLKKNGHFVNYQLPQKTWWNRFDSDVLNQRMKDLQGYLDVLLKNTISTENPLIKEFLEVDTNMLELARKQSFNEMSQSERLGDIVKETRASMLKIPVATSALAASVLSPTRKEEKKKSGLLFGGASSYRVKRSDSIDSNASHSTTATMPINAMTGNRDRMQSFDLTSQGSHGASTSISSLRTAQQVVLEANRREKFLRMFESHPDLIEVLADFNHMLSQETLPRVEHDSQDITEILSAPDQISSILGNILEREMDAVLEASPQTTLSLLGTRLIRHIRTTLASSSISHSPMNSLTRTASEVSSQSSSFSAKSATGGSPGTSLSKSYDGMAKSKVLSSPQAPVKSSIVSVESPSDESTSNTSGRPMLRRGQRI